MKKRIATSIIIFIVLTFIVLILDYLNCMGGININWDFISIFIGNGIIVLLYYITFCALDKRAIAKDENQAKIAYAMIKETCKVMKGTIGIWTPDMVRSYVIPKINLNGNLSDDPIIINIYQVAFQFDEHIFEFAKEGIISDKVFETYIRVKTEYKSFINMTITFFDHQEFWSIAENNINIAIEEMEGIINEQYTD